MTHPSVHVQIAPTSVPSTPSWLAEVAVMAHVFSQLGHQKAIEERVRFVRARMGDYEVIDFVVMLLGYAVPTGCATSCKGKGKRFRRPVHSSGSRTSRREALLLKAKMRLSKRVATTHTPAKTKPAKLAVLRVTTTIPTTKIKMSESRARAKRARS